MLPDLSIWAVALASIGITVYTFTVAFLGDSIQRAQKEEEITRKKKTDDFQLKYTDLQNKMNQLKESGDSTGVEQKAKEIRITQKKYDKEIKRIQSKYHSFHFIHSIAYPGIAFLGCFVFSEFSKSPLLPRHIVISLWLLSLLLISFGIYKFLKCLLLIQEISLTSEDQKIKMRKAFEEALISHDKETQEELQIVFHKQQFPLTISPDVDIKIDYRVSLKNGKVAHNVEVWFFVPDGFGLITPPENEAWRQDEDFVVPKIRTVRKVFGNILKSTVIPGFVTIKTPKVEGQYFILYTVKSEEFAITRTPLEINVKQE
jgi:hypothetical protein